MPMNNQVPIHYDRPLWAKISLLLIYFKHIEKE